MPFNLFYVIANLEKKQESFFLSWQKLAQLLSQHEELDYFFLGGLGIRMRAADRDSLEFKKENLRVHQDIDLIVFDEDIIECYIN